MQDNHLPIHNTAEPTSTDEAAQFILMLYEDLKGILSQLSGASGEDYQKRRFGTNRAERDDWIDRTTYAYSQKLARVKQLNDYLEINGEARLETMKAAIRRNRPTIDSNPDWLDDNSLEDTKVDIQSKIKPMPTHKPSQDDPYEAQMQSIAERLFQARRRLNLTQAEVGQQLGFDTGSSISGYESLSIKIPLRAFLELCDMYAVSPLWVLTGEEEAIDREFKERYDKLKTEVEDIASLLQSLLD